MWRLVLLLGVGLVTGAPPPQWLAPQPAIVQPEQPQGNIQDPTPLQHIPPRVAGELIKDFENEVVRMYTLKTLAEGIRLEQAAEDKILEAAVETLQEEPSPERNQRLQEVEDLLKRDKRAVQALSGLIGSSSGGQASGGASAGSDSGSILNLVGPLLGSSSGGGGGGSSSSDGDGGAPAGGSDSGSILSLVGPLLSSSSSGGSSSGGDGASAAAGSDSGSILGLVGPLLSSSSSGGGASAGGSAGASGGSDSGSILGLVGPLLSSSSSGGGTGGSGGASVSAGSDSGSILNLIVPLISSSSSSGGDASGGSGLGSILSISSSSKGGGGGTGGGGIAVDAGGQGGAGIIGQIKGAKIALVGDKIQLLLRVKFGLLNKVLTTITKKIAIASLPPQGGDLQNLKYPD